MLRKSFRVKEVSDSMDFKLLNIKLDNPGGFMVIFPEMLPQSEQSPDDPGTKEVI